MFKFLISAAVFCVLATAGRAEQLVQVGQPAGQSDVAARQAAPTSSLDLSVVEPFTLGYVSPVFGPAALGVAAENALFAAPPLTQILAPNFATTYNAQFNGSQLGLTAGFINGGSLYTSAATPGWNLGASVGYAGFYLHAGISDATQQRLLNDPSKGWLAGFGYQAGGFNVRLSYMTAQAVNTTDPDSRTWMIGGIYQLSPRVRLNADAFTSRDLRAFSTPTTAPSNVAAPQGTGARVGVQLRF